MKQGIDRRALLAAGGALALTGGVAFAQTKPNLRFSAVFSEQDIRAEMMKRFGEAIKDDFTLQPYYGGNLFKQGTELVAMQRNNLEMGNIAPQDVSNQLPAWSIVTSAYLFRDAEHLKKVFASDVGRDLKTMAEDKLNIKILGPTYFGARQVGLKPKKKINTPADLAGVKLRMPGGDAWQFLGQSLGANPTPMAYAEVYTGLQSGAIDGQDNPLPNVQNMKFYEVSSQIVLTSHLVGFDLLCVTKRVWDGMDAKKQAAFQAAADAAIDWSTKEHLAKEAELVDFFKKQGLEVYAPDLKAFRDFAQKKYLESELAKGWTPGMLDKINAL
ncbi:MULTISPECIES: TRAP transporter substrate-binding protein DctP [unclassified Bosea (in: a-proteobacteria)]|uniref:TRAP transporter substrate-binding protein DctP n=1 Tax=unclassified Bosea (in: a-proteobacteria) TaxID=2653178 RepID=UPI000F762451|nr:MULTISPECIES: TRAP transporter substrate-binding protein DctP [unclassified Bosea (in: a-proteobacteria)]AZO77762.1 C4-dicarboxylate ABC transporter [Bosea sp. Tri-49]RXT18377.1 C4-dicarboxylate ABC transporter [Bosea sp. Tri-39]RXT32973.1 C4-dicarboxylate ABC transporter [Bosea sp. Tri-54]